MGELMTDEEKIRRVLALSMHYADDRDARARSDLYAEDARYYPSSGEVIGRAAIFESMAGRAGGGNQTRKSKHMTANSAITINGDTAQATTDYVVYRRDGEGPWDVVQVGRYQDRFVRHGETWLFSENRIVTL
jgi:3-phenylpropionate/cinnamic acid dioxygenase small subunit